MRDIRLTEQQKKVLSDSCNGVIFGGRGRDYSWNSAQLVAIMEMMDEVVKAMRERG